MRSEFILTSFKFIVESTTQSFNITLISLIVRQQKINVLFNFFFYRLKRNQKVWNFLRSCQKTKSKQEEKGINTEKMNILKIFVLFKNCWKICA